MGDNRGLGVVVAVALAVAVGTGAEVSGPAFPPGVEELLPQAVRPCRARWLSLPGAPGLRVSLLAVGDLTGDGLDDVIVSDSQAIHVFAGQLDGTLAYQLAGFYEVQWNNGNYIAVGSVLPVAGELCDLDGDGSLDLAVAVVGGNWSVYLFRNAGRGRLEKRGAFVLPDRPHGLWVADFTADGQLDLLWWTADLQDAGALYLHKGIGPLAFSAPKVVATTTGRPFALADINHDGMLDLALNAGERILVLIGAEREATRTLDWAPQLGRIEDAVVSGSSSTETRFVLATSQGLVIAGYSADGFKVQQLIRTAPLARIFLVDLTWDGVEDALVQTRHGVWTVVPGTGSGSFGTPTSEFLFPHAPAIRPGLAVRPIRLGEGLALVLASEPCPLLLQSAPVPKGESTIPFEGGYLLAVGDLSGNGAPDLVVEGAAGLDVLWNRGDGAFLRRPLLVEDVAPIFALIQGGRLYLLHIGDHGLGTTAVELWIISPTDQMVVARHVLEVFPAGSLGTVRPALCVADLDGDASLDLLVIKEREILVAWEERYWMVYPWTKGEISLACCGSFSRPDLPEVAVLTSTGVHFASFPNRLLASARSAVEFDGIPLAAVRGDLDRDGLDDLTAVGVRITMTLEDKRLTFGVGEPWGWVVLSTRGPIRLELPTLAEDDAPWPLSGLAIGDYTGDGKQDLAFTTIQGAGVFLLPGRGDGSFAQGFWLKRQMGPLFAADLDRTGHHELVASSVGFNPYLWILWNGGGR